MGKLAFHNAAIATIILAAHSAAASTPAEMSLAGYVAGRDLYKTADTSDQTSFEDQWARMARIVKFDQRIFPDPSAQVIWSEAQADADRALAALARIAQIDNKKPSDFDVVVSTLKAATEDTKDKDRKEWGQDAWVRLLMEINKADLEKQFRAAEWTLNAKLAELAATVRSSDAIQGIGITHLPSWQGAYDHDALVLTNQTGRDLSAPAFFVTFQGQDGSRITHLHRASMWANGQQLHFKYPYYDTDYASGQTVNRPARLEVSVFSPDGFVQDVKLWSDEDYDTIVRRYMDEVKVTGVFLGEYVEDGSGTLYYPGFKFSTKGLNRLPVKRITVRFIRRGETREDHWVWNKYLPPDEEVVLRSRSLADFGKSDAPEQEQIILEFTDSSAQSTFTWGQQQN